MTDKSVWRESLIGLRDLPPSDEPETVADFVAALLVLLVIAFAFYFAALLAYSWGFPR